MNTISESSRARLDSLMKIGIGVGVLGAIGVGLGLAQNVEGNKLQFLQSYLYAYLFWLGLSLGSLAFAILHYLTGGRWGVRLERILQSGMGTLPLMLLLFLPIWMNMQELYPWSRPGAMDSALMHKKVFWLNAGGWTTRIFVYFGIWLACAWFLTSRAKKKDVTGDQNADSGVRFLAGPMIILHVLAVTFAVIDWAMSLEPEWFSTMYGVIFVAGQGISTLAFAVLICAWLRKDEQFGKLFSSAHFHDLGTLMFAFSMFWTYTSFSQYLIIWSGNIAEETPWYLHRTGHGWQNVAIALVVLGWFLPFLLLMQRKIKKQAHLLVGVAVIVLVARHFDLYWQIGPAFHHDGFHGPHWMDLAMPFAIGGFWVALFAWLMKARPITNNQVEMIHAEAHAAHH
ncbi:MAG: hypothetical protein IPJ77_10505 [Planctomycetes bacterium]|nr:hypothetical protein [Planctomycetota bacterium]